MSYLHASRSYDPEWMYKVWIIFCAHWTNEPISMTVCWYKGYSCLHTTETKQWGINQTTPGFLFSSIFYRCDIATDRINAMQPLEVVSPIFRHLSILFSSSTLPFGQSHLLPVVSNVTMGDATWGHWKSAMVYSPWNRLRHCKFKREPKKQNKTKNNLLSQTQTFYNWNYNKSHLLNLPGGRALEKSLLSLSLPKLLPNKGERSRKRTTGSQLCSGLRQRV